MRLNFIGGIVAVFFVAALVVGYSSLFSVYQTEQALVVRLGQPVRVVDEAESADVFRVPVADLLDPDRRATTVLRRDGQEWRGPGFVVPHATGEHLVWGFTAMLLDGLFTRLGWTEPWDHGRELQLDRS